MNNAAGRMRKHVLIGMIAAIMAVAGFGPLASGDATANFACEPTPSASKGPFYKPDPPVRSSVGQGYVLTGQVKSAKGCSPLPGAEIEFWLAGPDGEYDEAHRATVYAGEEGRYRFESNFPPEYSFRPPHIHIRVAAEGHKTLVTQHYPEPDDERGTFDLVLVPAD